MLELIKKALRISSTDYDDELTMLWESALTDMEIAGADKELLSETDPLVQRAVITYCKVNFGSPSDYDRLKASYDEQKAQIRTATGYTDWGDDDE